jgi:hypothetical protein
VWHDRLSVLVQSITFNPDPATLCASRTADGPQPDSPPLDGSSIPHRPINLAKVRVSSGVAMAAASRVA